MRVLVACEFSGRVRDAFRSFGHDAWSCDLEPTEVAGPHIVGDVIPLLSEGWDLLVAHPPCTYLSDAGRAWAKRPGRHELAMEALAFFLAFFNAPIPRVCVENPKSAILNAKVRKPDQVIHPYYFGEPQLKRTCLWLRGLPRLEYSFRDDLFGCRTACDKPEPICVGRDGERWYATDAARGSGKVRQKNRSRTFQAIALAMASQWGSLA